MNNNIRFTQSSYNVNLKGTGKGPAGHMKNEISDILASIETDRSSVTLSPAALNNISSGTAMELPSEHTSLQQTSRFSFLPAEDKKRYKDTLMHLNKDARLFVMDEKKGMFRRCAAPEVKHAFDNGGEVFLVTRVGKEVSSNYKDSNTSSGPNGDFIIGKSYSAGSKESSKSEFVNYSASKMSSWDDLDFVDTDGRGVPGTPYLPESGSRVLISNSWEKAWFESRSQTISDAVSSEFYNSSSGGYSSYEKKAEG